MTCPHCKAPEIKDDLEFVMGYQCGSWSDKISSNKYQSKDCRIAELNNENAELKASIENLKPCGLDALIIGVQAGVTMVQFEDGRQQFIYGENLGVESDRIKVSPVFCYDEYSNAAKIYYGIEY